MHVWGRKENPDMETDYKCSLSQTSTLLTLMPHNHWIFCKQDAQIPGLKDKIFKYQRKFSVQQNFIGSKTTKKNEDSWERKTKPKTIIKLYVMNMKIWLMRYIYLKGCPWRLLQKSFIFWAASRTPNPQVSWILGRMVVILIAISTHKKQLLPCRLIIRKR